jgi:hypothetical protein
MIVCFRNERYGIQYIFYWKQYKDHSFNRYIEYSYQYSYRYHNCRNCWYHSEYYGHYWCSDDKQYHFYFWLYDPDRHSSDNDSKYNDYFMKYDHFYDSRHDFIDVK